jgi:hypothetical protein
VNGSEQLPLMSGLSPVSNPRGPVNPVPKMTAACTGCHDGDAALAHAVSNTNQIGESCGVCHGANADFSVTRVHQP